MPELIGIIGSIILVIGAAWPVKTTGHPALSTKNQLFAVGNMCMFTHSIVNYFNGGEVFFVLLQILIAVSTVLMLLNTNDTFDATLLSFAGACLVTYSFFLFRDYTTIIFVLGLVTLGTGFAFNMKSIWRQVALAIGSVLIAVFSFLVRDPIFLWLNVFFAVFSFYHAWRLKSLVSQVSPVSQKY